MYGEMVSNSANSKPLHCRDMGEQIGAPAGLFSEEVTLWARGEKRLPPTGLEAQFPGLCAVRWPHSKLFACFGLCFVLRGDWVGLLVICCCAGCENADCKALFTRYKVNA